LAAIPLLADRLRTRAEPLGEGNVGVVVEVVLAAEEHDLVLQQGLADALHDGVVEVSGQPDTVDPGADAPPELVHLEVGGEVVLELERHGSPFVACGPHHGPGSPTERQRFGSA
jgi:hypothetical protein